MRLLHLLLTVALLTLSSVAGAARLAPPYAAPQMVGLNTPAGVAQRGGPTIATPGERSVNARSSAASHADNVDSLVALRTTVFGLQSKASGLKPAAELDGNGLLLARFAYGSKPTVPDFIVRGGETYRIISDHLGSPVLAVNVNDPSDRPFQASYSPFGEAEGTNLDWLPFGFAGGHYDTDTGLVRFGARDYEPMTGRWTAKDPIRWEGRQANLYLYSNGTPTNRVDPTGLDTFMCYRPLGGAFGAGGTVFNSGGVNHLLHQYLCVVDPSNRVECGGQTPAGNPLFGPGAPSDNHWPNGWDGAFCENADRDRCVDACVRESLRSPVRPDYSLFDWPGTNCQGWADDTLTQCQRVCGDEQW